MDTFNVESQQSIQTKRKLERLESSISKELSMLRGFLIGFSPILHFSLLQGTCKTSRFTSSRQMEHTHIIESD